MQQYDDSDDASGVDESDYRVVERIGCGAFGIVYKAKCDKTGAFVAIKCIELRGGRGRLPPLEVFREISALRNVHHENVVKLLATHFEDNTAALVMEYARSNFRLVIADLSRPRCFTHLKFYFKQLFSALAHLHGLGIMHRDVKPENILVDGRNRVKLADFGQACLYFPDDSEHVYDHEVATRWYRAPELLFGATHYTPTVDVWAAGCVLGEFLTGASLFSGFTDLEQLIHVFQLFGTPTENNWSGWRRLPDSSKIEFDSLPPADDARWREFAGNPAGREFLIDFTVIYYHSKVFYFQAEPVKTERPLVTAYACPGPLA